MHRGTVVDTNVFVSGLLFGGKPQEALAAAVSGRATSVRPGGVAEVTALAEWVIPRTRFEVAKDDPPDNEVIDCAAECGADCIVTGDARLLRLREFRGIRVADVSGLLRVLEQRGA